MLQIEGLTVTYGTHPAVADLSLTANDGEVVCVLGPSGCGKSTLLRAIAGLEPVRSGRIVLDGVTLDAQRPDQRGVGLMFQDHALFPHRSVGDNVAFGPRMRGLPRPVVTERVRESLALVSLSGTEDRAVTTLSGGEQQRVALARAIAPRPRLLMLDEPLGSLDRALRDRLLDDLPGVFERIGTTVLYVTHDQAEALALADRVAVMRAGHIERDGPPDEVWRSPRTEFVARFLGNEHLFDATVEAGVARMTFGAVPLPGLQDGPVRLVLLPEALRLLAPDELADDGPLVVDARVSGRRFAGDHVRVQVVLDGGTHLLLPVWRGACPPVGSGVRLAIDPAGLRVLEPEGQ
jgi:thiamine transport system ATP-binding protein